VTKTGPKVENCYKKVTSSPVNTGSSQRRSNRIFLNGGGGRKRKGKRKRKNARRRRQLGETDATIERPWFRWQGREIGAVERRKASGRSADHGETGQVMRFEIRRKSRRKTLPRRKKPPQKTFFFIKKRDRGKIEHLFGEALNTREEEKRKEIKTR